MDGLLELLDRETGQLVKVGVTPDLLRRYRAHFEEWCDTIAVACRAQRAHYVRVSTTVAPRDLILRTLRQDGILR